MLCKVSFLRLKGIRRPDEDVKAGPWLVGTVSLQPCAGIRSRKDVPVAHLMPADGKSEPIATIFDVRVRINPRGLLLSGVEETWDRKVKTERRQSWWCLPCAPIPLEQPISEDLDDPKGRRVLRFVSVFDAEPPIKRLIPA